MSSTAVAAETLTTDISLSIKSLEQQTKSVSLPRNSSILDLKHKIQVLFDVEGTRQRLIFQGKVLKDDKTLLDYENLDDGKVIHLVIRPINSPHNPANDEPQRQQRTTSRPPIASARQISERYAVITLEATLGDLADNQSLVSTLMNQLLPSATNTSTPPPPSDNSIHSPFSPRPPPHQSMSRSILPDPLRLPHHHHTYRIHQFERGEGTDGARERQQRILNSLGLGLGSNNSTSRRHTAQTATAAGIDDFINGFHAERSSGSTSFSIDSGEIQMAAAAESNNNSGRHNIGELPLPSTVEMRLSRTLSYIREIRLLLDQPILEADNNNLNRHNRRQHVSSLRAIRESRELLRNQGGGAQSSSTSSQVALVVQELADLMELLAPWLRNLGQSLASQEEEEEGQDTQQHQLAHVLRAARITQITSLINHFLSSVLASAEPVTTGETTTETWNPFSNTAATSTNAERLGRSFTAAAASSSTDSATATTTTEQDQQTEQETQAKRKHKDDNEQSSSSSASSSSSTPTTAKKSKTHE